MNAADRIRALQASGLSQREIARRLGVGPSYVSKVATGRKPGRNLDAPLSRLQAGAERAPAPRRRTKSGDLARVRGGRPVVQAPATSGRGGLAGQVEAGARADGLGGQLPSGAEWNVIAYRDGAGWTDLREGGGGWSTPRAVEYVVVEIPGVGFRQFATFFTDEYDLYALIADVLEEYGVAE